MMRGRGGVGDYKKNKKTKNKKIQKGSLPFFDVSFTK
jgi:hypothetical protein